MFNKGPSHLPDQRSQVNPLMEEVKVSSADKKSLQKNKFKTWLPHLLRKCKKKQRDWGGKKGK